jgi:Holliday junction resolvase RusA-like endonuclease
MNILLNVRIPGEPVVWKRHGGFGARSFDRNRDAKNSLRWQVKAAAPAQKINPDARLGIRIVFWSQRHPVRKHGVIASAMSFREDLDNFAKHVFDAMNGLIWNDDSQVDEAELKVHRMAEIAATDITVWELGGRA